MIRKMLFIVGAIAMVALITAGLTLGLPAKSTTSAAAAAARVSVGVIIHIGKPGTCKGFGICKIEVGGTLSKRSVRGTLTAEDNGKLSLSVQGKVPEEEPTLVLEQDLSLSSAIAQKLGVKSATITKGSYRFSGGRAVFDAKLVR
jgi:hypothetical protein